jgi:hypothetical protein
MALLTEDRRSEVQFWRGRLTAGGVVLEQDSACVRTVAAQWRGDQVTPGYGLEVPVVTLGNVRWREYLGSDLIRVGEIFVDYPALRVQRNVQSAPVAGSRTEARDSAADSLVGALF